MKNHIKGSKRIAVLLMCLLMVLAALPVGAFAAETTLAGETTTSVAPAYSIDGKYTVNFRGYIGGKFETFFVIAIPCGTKTVRADYVWALDPKNPYGNNYGWLLRINGRVCSTIYGSSYGFPSGIPEIGVTTSQFTGNLSFIKDYDMSTANWSYNIPNTGNGNVITNMLGSAAAIRVNVPILYVNRENGATVANDTHQITAYGTSTAVASAAKVPAGYELDPASQSQTVTYTGSTVTPNQIIFYVKPVQVIEAQIKIIYNFDNGEWESFEYRTLTSLGFHTIYPDPAKIPANHYMKPSSPTSYVVNVTGPTTVTPNEVIFYYEWRP